MTPYHPSQCSAPAKPIQNGACLSVVLIPVAMSCLYCCAPVSIPVLSAPNHSHSAGRNAFDGFTPSVPEGENLDFGAPRFLQLEDTGLTAAGKAAFVLVAGGLGERLGYKGEHSTARHGIAQHSMGCLIEHQLWCRCSEGCHVISVLDVFNHNNTRSSGSIQKQLCQNQAWA